MALFAGAILSPVILFVIEGDEIFGFIGIAMALLTGWISKKAAMILSCTPLTMDIIRLCGAALGPMIGFALIKMMFMINERREEYNDSHNEDHTS